METSPYVLNMWQPWADQVVRGAKRLENRPWPAEGLVKTLGPLPVRVFVYATKYVDWHGFRRVGEILGTDPGALYWRPWATGAIVGAVTILGTIPRQRAREWLGERGEDADVLRWADEREGQRWLLVGDAVQFASPVPWSSRQGRVVGLDAATHERARNAAIGEPDWIHLPARCSRCRAFPAPIGPSGSGFYCGNCGALYRADGSSVESCGKSAALWAHDPSAFPNSAPSGDPVPVYGEVGPTPIILARHGVTPTAEVAARLASGREPVELDRVPPHAIRDQLVALEPLRSRGSWLVVANPAVLDAVRIGTPAALRSIVVYDSNFKSWTTLTPHSTDRIWSSLASGRKLSDILLEIGVW